MATQTILLLILNGDLHHGNPTIGKASPRRLHLVVAGRSPPSYLGESCERTPSGSKTSVVNTAVVVSHKWNALPLARRCTELFTVDNK